MCTFQEGNLHKSSKQKFKKIFLVQKRGINSQKNRFFNENQIYGGSWLSDWGFFDEEKLENYFLDQGKMHHQGIQIFSLAIKGGDYFDMDKAFNQPRSSQICAHSWD